MITFNIENCLNYNAAKYSDGKIFIKHILIKSSEIDTWPTMAGVWVNLGLQKELQSKWHKDWSQVLTFYLHTWQFRVLFN